MSQWRVLVVDDEESIVTICRLALQRLDLHVDTATTAAEALTKVKNEGFDIALVDWILPDGNGLDLFRAMQALAPQILGILITGQSLAETNRDALEAGFWAALFKPFTVTELQGIVQRAMAYLQAVRERERLQLMVSLSEVARHLAASLDLDEVLHRIVRVAREQTGADRVSLMVVDDTASPTRLRLVAADGLPSEWLNREIAVAEGIAGLVAQTGEPLLVNTQTIQALSGVPLRYQGMGSALCLPLKLGSRVVGVLNLTRFADERVFSDADVHLYLVLAAQAALAVENARLYRRLWEGHLAALASFARYAEALEGYRRGHADRVGIYAQALAKAAGWTPKDAEQLRVAGLAHDLGLLQVPRDILLKPTRLSDDEWQLVRQHPLWSLELIDRPALLTDLVTAAVRYHHERFDGTGYPDGLRGDQIPLPARILAVADTFDALSHDRPYRPAYPRDQAIAELTRAAGTQLDPDLTHLFVTQVLLELKETGNGSEG
ncbi:3'3'-cGAMP-specific phosphodiesterase 3 [bacterium HR17]|uniref:3'3'-cGAMP-specific phosphodiesterase 3 n=1 Tax=Candidatus Fervidibacter japonicus TaxID=2035412 RepID=A0A2H5XEM9_9BACT|nr:3'3'-cGAMP-specific phosphodiesterase 3 [bacterium HR17]